MKLSEINNNFYDKINASRKLESFRSCLKNINKNYINKLPNLFFKYLDKNLNFSIYEKKLKDIFNFQFDANKIYEKLNNQYQKEKNENKINISLLEISNSNNFHYNNYQNNDIQIVKYKDVNADNTDNDSIETYKKELNRWFDENSKSKNDINIIIINSEKFNVYGLHTLAKLTTKEISEKNYILFYKKEDWFPIINESLVYTEKIKIDKIEDILNLDILKLNKKKQFMRKKLYLFFNYVDKLLKNKIILDNDDNDENNENDNYLDELLIKINQEWAIYSNYDISKFNINVIDGNKLKQLINEIYSNIYISEFKNDIINTIIKILGENLSFTNEIELRGKIINIYKIKFNSETSLFKNIFYKYFEKKYIIFKKIIKNDFIEKFLDNEKDKFNCQKTI